MLILPLKPTVRYELSLALSYWLDSDTQVSFEPANPLQFILPKPDFHSTLIREELLRLQSLRNCLCECFIKSDSHKNALKEGNAVADCHEYHAVLLEYEKRGFPTYDSKDTNITITWKGAFAPQKETHATLVWERACIIYNTVALLTQQASECSPTDRDECKKAVSLYQQGASLLAILRELCDSQYDKFLSVDLSNSMLSFWETLLLASAQTNIYRMASLNTANNDNPGKQHRTLAVLSQAAYNLFNKALKAAQDPRLQSEVPKQSEVWASFCKSNSMLCASKAEYHQSVVYRVNNEHGKEIAQLRDCLNKLEQCRDFLKSINADNNHTYYTQRECMAILPVVQDRLHEADQDNMKNYHEEIPKNVPDIDSQQLAKINPALPESMLIPKKPLFLSVS